MKANELRIGDFLRYKQDFPFAHLQGKIVKVCGVDGRVDVRTINDGKFHESEHPNWLEPIPLTPEILEKNGWRKYGPDFSNNNVDFELESYRDGGFGIRVLADEYGSGTFACIKYVHELQHALRLCGIEKEIEL